MTQEIELYDGRVILVDHLPDCPQCGERSSDYQIRFGAICDADNLAYIWIRHQCGKIFTATYEVRAGWGLEAKLISGPAPHYFRPTTFASSIHAVSKEFCAIYDEAKLAEESGLTRICGVGYRKALEFLVKDYLIRHRFVEDREVGRRIENAPLAMCIDGYIDDEGIKQAAHRAAWLGNDETHYARKWTNNDVTDLKALIAITVEWIDLNMRLHGHIKAMPDKKPK